MPAAAWLLLALLAAHQETGPSALAAGRRLYVDQKCSACHQIAGEGNKRFPLDGVGRRLTATDLRRWFTHTVEMEARLPRQPAIKMSSRKFKFTPAELDALVAYLQSLK